MNAEINKVLKRLSNSNFRSRFHLSQKDIEYIDSKRIDKIESHAKDFIKIRLAPAVIKNDGKQTPMKGHPVFIAQHATATCCRECLSKWHHISKEKELSREEQDYIIELIMKWINNQLSN